MPLRRRPESDGGAACAPVALARYTVGQQAADISRPSPCLRQQPHRRVAHRHRETAARAVRPRRPLRIAPTCRSSQTPTSSLRSREPSSSAAGWPTLRMTPPMSSGKRNAGSIDCARARDGNRSPISGAHAGCGRIRNTAPDPAVFASLADKLMTGRCELPEKTSAALLHERRMHHRCASLLSLAARIS